MSEEAIVKLYIYHGTDSIGLVESITSLQWMPAWNDVGEFKLVCAPSEKNRTRLIKWATLYNPDTPQLAAVITAVKTETDKMTVRGQFGLCRFKQRVAKGSRTITDAAAGLLEVCRTNLRGLPITVPENAAFTAPCEETVEWMDCCSAIVQLAKAGGFGVRVRFDKLTASETLELYQGIDRSRQGSENYHGFFGTRMRNLSSPALDDDGSDYANVILCGGEKPTEQDNWKQLFLEVGDTTSTGTDRHELWVDGSSVTHRYTIQKADGSTEEATYSEAEYQTALTNYATAALLEHLGGQTLKATAAETLLHYGKEYDLGDIVPLRVPELGLTASARVSSVKLTYEQTRSVQPVFDNITLGGDTI